MPISRREFFLNTARNAALAGVLYSAVDGVNANPLGLPIGCQTYPVRDDIGRDFPGTLKQLSAAGFQTIELCSPVGYAGSGLGALAKLSPGEICRIIAAANLHCISCHFDINELRKDLPGRVAWAKEMGLTQMMVPSLDGPKTPTMEDVKHAADEYNHMAEQTARAGIQLGLHNEDFETSKVSGKRTYDLLLHLLDPRLVKMQFQVSTISQGFSAIEYFTRYPGRFISMHVQGWNSKTRKICPVGQGTLDWLAIFRSAKDAGVKNYFVEMDLAMMRASVPYLHELHV